MMYNVQLTRGLRDCVCIQLEYVLHNFLRQNIDRCTSFRNSTVKILSLGPRPPVTCFSYTTARENVFLVKNCAIPVVVNYISTKNTLVVKKGAAKN